MKKLFAAADQYIQRSDWKTIAVLKFCLLALGVLAGMAVPAKHKKAVAAVALPVFAVTCFPLLFSFAREALQKDAGPVDD